ncbi:hypothetical protein [Streptomyces sp. Inha503]
MSTTIDAHDRLEEGAPSVIWVTAASKGRPYTAAAHRVGSAPRSSGW